MQRHILGTTAIVLLAGAAAIRLWRPDAAGALAFCWRGGALAAAAWLAFDDVQRLPGWLLLAVPVVLIVAARWPRLLLIILPLLVLWSILRPLLGGR
ncbi:MAG: hypothetical protein JW959_01130 [Pirellulales bacterium]|nr:hypothetical protein [Pirellulales bacterium]